MSDKAARPRKRKGKPAGAVVRLEDLAPRKDATGGSGKVLFGQDADRPDKDKPARPRK